MSVLLIIVLVWVVLGALALVMAVALGRAAKRGDEMLWRARLTRMLAARGRRADERRTGDRRSRDPSSPRAGAEALDRRHGERRRFDRRADPGWRDAPNY
jgi:hypothetical protein